MKGSAARLGGVMRVSRVASAMRHQQVPLDRLEPQVLVRPVLQVIPVSVVPVVLQVLQALPDLAVLLV